LCGPRRLLLNLLRLADLLSRLLQLFQLLFSFQDLFAHTFPLLTEYSSSDKATSQTGSPHIPICICDMLLSSFPCYECHNPISMKPPTIFLGEHTNLQLEAFLNDHQTVIITVGALEPHGPHSARLAADVIPAETAPRERRRLVARVPLHT